MHALNGAVTIYDRRRKQDIANKLMQRWQRWEISNFDYLMQVSIHMKVPLATYGTW